MSSEINDFIYFFCPSKFVDKSIQKTYLSLENAYIFKSLLPKLIEDIRYWI